MQSTGRHDREVRSRLSVEASRLTFTQLGWKSGDIDTVELKIRSSLLCPGSALACPLRYGLDVGATLVPTGSYECVEVRFSVFPSFECELTTLAA